jgi:hypothetical protein
MQRTKIAVAGLLAAATVGGSFLLGASPAMAATPSFEPDPNSLGSVVFYNAAGNIVTSGTDLSNAFSYVSVAGLGRVGADHATVYIGFPDHTKSDSTTWNVVQGSASQVFPITATGTPSSISSLVTPTAKGTGGVFDLTGPLGQFSLDTTTGYANMLQIRIKDSGTGNPFVSKFWESDIQVDLNNNTWTQVSPAAAPTTSITTPSASTANPAPSGTTSVSLSSTLSASYNGAAIHPGGTVHLFNGATDLGAATLNAATGAISATATVADGQSYNYSFQFTNPTYPVPTATSSALSYAVNLPTQPTTTVVSGPMTGTVGTPVTYTAAVTAGAGTPTGTVQFKVDGANLGGAVSVASAASPGVTYTPADINPHVITAVYTSSNPTAFSNSSDNTGVTLTASAPAYTPDPQNVTVVVPQGTLVISTPYTAANPLSLGTLGLNAGGTAYSTAPVAFGDPIAAAAADPGTWNGSNPAALTNGVTITDTRAASTGWTAKVSTTDFTSGTNSFDGNDLTFDQVTPKYITGNHLQAGSVSTNNVSAFKTPKAFATTTQGPGTVNITGKLHLDGVSTSTVAGTYTATLTFTVV